MDNRFAEALMLRNYFDQGAIEHGSLYRFENDKILVNRLMLMRLIQIVNPMQQDKEIILTDPDIYFEAVR